MAAAFRDYAAAGSGQSAGVTSLPIVVPTTAVVGDYATIFVNSSSTTATLTTPTGWTLNGGPFRSSNSSVWRYSKTIASGDIGATVTLTFSASQRCEALMMVASGVDPSGASGTYYTETSSTANPTLPSVSGAPAGSVVFGVFLRRFGATPAGTVHLPTSYTEVPAVNTGYGSSPELSIVGGSATATGGTISGTGSSSPSSTGVNYIVYAPASTTAGSSATVALATATVTASANPLTVTGAGTAPPGSDALYRSAIRSGGLTITYLVSASAGGVPVTGAQNLSPTGGSITDTTKPGVRRVLNLELAPEVGLYDLLAPEGTTLTVTARVRYTDRSTYDIPMGVFDVDSQTITEGGGKIALTAPDKWVRIQRSRFLQPTPSAAGYPVVQQIAFLIQGALGSSESVSITATSTAQVGALTWDRDRDKAIMDLAQSIGAWVFFDRQGQATIADIPSVAASADWLVNAGPSGVLTSLDRQRSRTETYNVVVVSSSASAGPAFPTQYIWDNDPNSPTYAGTDPLNNPGSAGPFGIVPYFYSSAVLSSASEAYQAGVSILARTTGLASQVSLSQVPNPALDAFQSMDVLPPGEGSAMIVGSSGGLSPASTVFPGSSTFPDSSTFPVSGPPIVRVIQSGAVLERHVIDTVTHPLVVDSGSPQQVAGRSTRSDPYTSDVTS